MELQTIPTPATSSAPRVLLVDDEPVTARGYARLLMAEGYDVTVANAGREAARLAENIGFDVVVSDLAMPDMDGLGLLRAIRRNDLDVPMIFLTGSPALETAVRAIEYGAFRYLVKPVGGDELIEVVSRAVRLHRLARVRREAARELLGRPIGDRAGLEAHFSSALQRLWMAAQPIVSWSTQTVFAYEVLLRTDESALRNPLDFLDAAERLDRTRDLGRAIRASIAAALRAAPPPTPVFVNLHPSDLEDPELLADDGALTPHASHVVLEITERAPLDQIRLLSARVSRLRELGYRIALDDLGAGYAGLASFAQFEPDVVKIDMSLVHGIDCSPVKQKLLRSIVALCRDLGIPLISEGIETEAERDSISALGGDLCQGYLFARPERGFPPARFR
jgi:EAL domain-containing protein (putative c-di-GMP-specific phosphodiesterase class I)/CheY-like chemotaxis protein